jgi:hypothetical protein
MKKFHSALLGLALMLAFTTSVLPQTKTCCNGSACCNGGSCCRNHHKK